MEERKRPYLGKCVTPNGKSYIVLFPSNEKDMGIIVMSEVTDNPDLQVGIMNDFDEAYFEYLDDDFVIRLNND